MSRPRPHSRQSASSLSLVVTVAFAFGGGGGGAHAGNYFVDATNGNDNNPGTSWLQAYATLQKALAVALANSGADHISVAAVAGGYHPDVGGGQTPGDQFATFAIPGLDTVEGGFEPGGGNEQSYPETFVTILSGDLDGDDVDGFGGGRDDNSYNVVKISADGSTLTGITIKGGNDSEGFGGGGVLVDGVSATIKKCRLTDNETVNKGGGLFLSIVLDQTILVEDCEFIANRATDGASGGGAGMREGGEVQFIKCRFIDNVADGDGGGLEADGGGTVTLANCSFVGNASGSTTSNHGGGALFADRIFVGAVNCLFASNTAKRDGGAILLNSTLGEFSAAFDDCTIADNSADADNNNSGLGGGFRVFGVGTNNTYALTVINAIAWLNEDVDETIASSQISLGTNGTATVTYSDITGGWSGTGNKNVDPYFRASGSYYLTAASECIDTGTTGAVPCDEFDVDGDGNDCSPSEETPDIDLRNRVLDGDGSSSAIVDMGAYEFVEPETCPWDCDLDPAPDGIVGINDMLELLFDWGSSSPCDFNGGGVGINDLLLLFANWGPCEGVGGSIPTTIEECIDKIGYEDELALAECICAVAPEACEEE